MWVGLLIYDSAPVWYSAVALVAISICQRDAPFSEVFNGNLWFPSTTLHVLLFPLLGYDPGLQFYSTLVVSLQGVTWFLSKNLDFWLIYSSGQGLSYFSTSAIISSTPTKPPPVNIQLSQTECLPCPTPSSKQTSVNSSYLQILVLPRRRNPQHLQGKWKQCVQWKEQRWNICTSGKKSSQLGQRNKAQPVVSLEWPGLVKWSQSLVHCGFAGRATESLPGQDCRWSQYRY